MSTSYQPRVIWMSEGDKLQAVFGRSREWFERYASHVIHEHLGSGRTYVICREVETYFERQEVA